MPHPLRAFNIPSGAQYGARRLSGRPHAGTDYHPPSNKDGDPIYATLNGGRISAKGYGPSPVNGFGHWVKVTYPGGVETTNAHMREACPFPVGALVGPTSVIGYVGHTGNAVIADPPGSHVHHELRVNGVLRDPYAYYGGANAPAASNAQSITNPEPEFEEEDSMKLWKYLSGKGEPWVLIDHLNKSYRVIPLGSNEEGAFDNDVNIRGRKFDVIADPAWGREFGNGQFRRID